TASKRQASAVALVLALCSIVVVSEGQSALKRNVGWAWRAWDLLFDVEYARHAAPEGGSYEQLLARVPHGDNVAVWVARPELLDYAQHRIVDLRTPRVARLRDSEKLAEVVSGAHAGWLLIEDDVPRALNELAENHPVAVAFGGVRLVDLR